MSAAARSLKDSGNNAFKAGKYEEAITLYTEAMKKDPSDSTYPLNRSMAYLKISKYAEAERDASKSLGLLPAGNTKALFRRATARKALGKIELARQDFHAVLQEDPSNQAAKAELASLPPSVKSTSATDASQSAARSGPGVASKAVDGGALDKGKGRARDEDTRDATAAPAGKQAPIAPFKGTTAPSKRDQDRRSALKAAITADDSDARDFLQAVSTRRLNTATSSSSGPASVTAASSSSAPTADTTSLKKDFRSMKLSREERQRPTPPAARPAETTTSTDDIPREVVPAKADVPQLKAPSTMYEFETRWRDRPDIAWRCALLQAVHEYRTELPAFFGQNLSPELIDEILVCLKESIAKNPSLRQTGLYFLDGLSRCARFDFVSMLCAEAAAVNSILSGETSMEADIRTRWGV